MQTRKIEVDQSIRVEELARDTILAMANKEFSYAVRLPGRLKRQLYEFFRARGMRKKFGPWVFAVAVAKLLENGLTQNKKIGELLHLEFTRIRSPANLWIQCSRLGLFVKVYGKTIHNRTILAGV